MQDNINTSRRSFLLSAACCLAAAPIMTPLTFAAMPSDNRFVTIVLRGAMDGLYMVQPYGDPLLKSYRPTLAMSPDSGLIDLDGFYGLHPAAKSLLPLWKSGELSFIQGVSTPYRSSRSHFDGQDMLESGGAVVAEEKTGWLNRALSVIPRSQNSRAIDINTSSEFILSGPNDVDVWSPSNDLKLADDELNFLADLYRGDAPFAKAMAEAMKTDMSVDQIYDGEKRGAKTADIAMLAAGMLKKEYRIASFSINGWDSHAGQVQALKRPIQDLADAILALKNGLGPDIWKKTVVMAMTEFGRTARENGTKGTDHGTGGMAILAGGGVSGGRMVGKWPGLKEDQLFDKRDLMPTGDVRELAAAMLYRQFNVTPGDLNNQIFPGLDFTTSSIFLG